MRKRLLMLLSIFMMITSVGWLHAQGDGGSSKLTHETTGTGASQRENVYANGHAVTLTANKEKGVTITCEGESPLSFEDGTIVTLYGGSKNAAVTTSTITMKGGTIRNIYGGGNGELAAKGGDKSADVTGKTTITIEGGTVSNLLVAGGMYFARSGEVVITVTGASTSISAPLMGGYDAGKTGNKLATAFDQSVNRVESTTFSMTGGKIADYISCGGGQGYSYSKTTNVTLADVEIAGLYGIGSNGCSDAVKMKATNCTFVKNGNTVVEISALNRGLGKDITMEFIGCTFPAETADYYLYAGATYGWDNGEGNVASVEGACNWKFTDCKNLPGLNVSDGMNGSFSITGTKLLVAPSIRQSGQLTAYEVKADKTWNCAGGIAVSGATLANKGTLNVAASDAEGLQAAVALKANKIDLTAGTYTLTSGLQITNPATITGAEGTVITTSAVTDNLVTIKSTKDVKLEGLTIQGAKKSGLHVYNSENVTLNNVTLAGNTNAGLIVNGSVVNATKLATKENDWGGVNVDKGQLVTNTPCFTFDATSTFAEPAQIWSELAGENAETLVDAPDGWNDSVASDGKRYWTNVAKALTYEFYQDFPNKPADWNKGYTFVYANGNPITIDKNGDGTKVIISVDGKNEKLEFDAAKNAVIFGGAKNAKVASSTITMKGGTVLMLFGGGYGEVTDQTVQYAGVTGSTTINITGGVIANSLLGGGLYYNHSNDVAINASGIEVKQWLICGGFESGKTSGDNYLDFDKSNNTVESAKLTINGGTYSLIAVGGTDGAKGYIRKSDATIENATIIGGIYGNGSNGRSDNVTATVRNCKFEGKDIELAPVNRGVAKSITYTFDGCDFSKAESLHANFGATYRWGYNYSGSSAKVEGIPGNVSYTFTNCTNTPVMEVSDGLDMANVILTGAKARIAKFEWKLDNDKKPVYSTSFTIGKDKTWTFKDGLEMAADGNAATITNKGTLVIPAIDIMTAGVAVGGALKVDADITTAVAEMDKAGKTVKEALLAKDMTITCKDGVLATNAEAAKALAKEGVAVKLLKLGAEDKLVFGEIDLNDPKITSLPSKVTFGTTPIALITNKEVKSIAITTGSGLAEIKNGADDAADSLVIKKPGDVVLTLTLAAEGDEPQGKSFTQPLTIEKKTISLVEGLTVANRAYNGSKDVTVAIEAVKLQGTVAGTAAEISQSGTTVTGQMADANAGEKKAVTFAENAITLKTGGDYYQLAPVTFVTVTIAKVDLAVTAKAKTGNLERDFGKANPEFDVTYGTFVNNETSSALEGVLKFDCPATESSLAGTYKVTPKGLTSTNYNLQFKAADLTVKAIAPTVETISVVVGADKKVTMTGKVLDLGGATETPVVSFKISTKADVTATLDAEKKTFTATATPGDGEYTVEAQAVVGQGKPGTGKAFSIIISADKPQTVEFATVLSKLVYGSADMQLVAKSNATGATYTYSVEDGDAVAVNAAGLLSVKKVGKANIKVTATAAGYVKTSVYQAIEVTPKTLQVTLSNASALTKEYDGMTSLTTQPAYNLTGRIGSDEVSLTAIEGARFASKDAGTQTILLPDLKLTGAAAANYKLAAVANPTGTITKGKVTIAVDPVERMWNDKYTQYAFTWTGFVVGEDEKTPGIYTGQLKVKENALTDQGTSQTGTLDLSTSTVALKNYTVEYKNSTVTVNKGNPVAIVYGQVVAKATEGLHTKLVDLAGYTGLTVEHPVAGEFASIKDASGNVVGQTINKVAKGTTVVSVPFSMPVVTKAAAITWNSDNKATYLDELTLPKAGDDMSYESTNPDILAITGVDVITGDLTCRVNGVGTAAILATNIKTYEVKFMYFEIEAKTVFAVPAAAYTKTYDGTTLASGLIPVLKDAKASGNNPIDDIALNVEGITFNFAQATAGNGNVTPSQELILTGSKKNNYLLDVTGLGGIINKAQLAITSPISKYYDGSKESIMIDYTATGRAEGAVVPVKATFASEAASADVDVSVVLVNEADKTNYTLEALANGTKGAILKSTYVATLPSKAAAKAEIAGKVSFTIAEANAPIAAGKAAGYAPNVIEDNGKFYVSGGDNDNYAVVYTSNSVTKSNPVTPPVDPEDPTTVEGISLDITSKTLPRTQSFTLTATVTPADAANKAITWKSSDETIVKVESTGDFTAKVTALSFGDATITVTTEDGAKTATCAVSVDFATSLEEAIANTRVFAKEGAICIEPVMPMDVVVVNMVGQIVYKSAINSTTSVIVPASGIYIVKLGNGSDAKVQKVNVK